MSWLEVEKGSTTITDHYEGEFSSIKTIPWQQYDWVNKTYYTARYPTTSWHWITDKVSSSTTFTMRVSEASTDVIRKTHRIDNLAHGTWKIRIRRKTPNNNSHRVGDRLFLTSIREVVYDDLTYPKNILVGLRALATNQLSGSFNFYSIVDGALINVWNGAAWTISYSNNPAWVCWDVLTQPVLNDSRAIVRYDGIDPTRLDRDAFYTWAQFCDTLVDDGKGGTEKRFTFNGIFDTELKLWEAALQICAMSRALLVWNGIVISVIVDKAVTLPSGAVQLFTMSNIIADSFEETFLSMEDRAGDIEVSFNNPDNNYDRDVITVHNTTIDKPTNKVSIDLIGCTSASQAWRTAQYQLLQNQYMKRMIKFDAEVDAVACTIGDVIYFSHDVPRWGQASGSVVSATNSPGYRVTLPNPVDIVNGTSYGIMVRLSDDTIVKKSVVTVAGNYSTALLTVSTIWSSVPQPDDKFSFGEVNVESKPFRVTEVNRTSENICTISATEYDANVYSVDSGTPVLPTYDYSTLESSPIVTNLFAEEVKQLSETGTVQRNIRVRWVKPVTNTTKSFNIYYRFLKISRTSQVGEVSAPLLAGSTSEQSFTFLNVMPGTKYEVTAICVNDMGVESKNPNTPSYTLTTTTDVIGVNPIIDNGVSGIQIYGQGNNNEFIGKDCKFVWNHISATNYPAGSEGNVGASYSDLMAVFKDYEVCIYNTNMTLRRQEFVLENYYTYSYERNCEDGTPVNAFIITVRARDTYLRASTKIAKLEVINSVPSTPTNLTIDFSGKDCIFSWDKCTDIDFDHYLLTLNSTAKKIQRNGFTYTFDDNKNDNGGGADPSLSYNLKIVDTFGNESTALTGTATNSAPVQPICSVNFTGKDCVFSWDTNDSADIDYYKLLINSITKRVSRGNVFTYTFDENIKDNTSADPSLSYSLSLVDVFGGESSTATGTATNTAPVAPTSVSVVGGFRTISIEFTACTEPDIKGYEIHVSTSSGFTPGAGTLLTSGPQTSAEYEGDTSTTYYVKIRSYDYFGQFSSYTSQVSAATIYIAPSELYTTLRTDFVVKTSIFSFTTTTLGWTAGSIIRDDTEYTLSSGSLTNAQGRYIIATLSGSSATLSTVTIGAALPTLATNQVILAYTSTTTTADGNYICYVRQANSMMVEGADIRDATIRNAKIYDLAVDKLTAGSITSKAVTLAVSPGTGDVKIQAGKTDFGSITSGFILGIDDSDSDKPKFEIGNDTNYLTYDGTTLTIAGVANFVSTASSGSNVSTILAPEGGIYSSDSSSVTGSIKVRLPQTWSNTMMRFIVDIFEYAAGYMCTLEISGYNYITTPTWSVVTARVLGGSNVEYPVYFGHDGTKCAVYIGAASATWAYAKIRVRDVLVGHQNYTLDKWAYGWQISIDAGGPANVKATVTDTYPAADWEKVSGTNKPEDNADVTGTHTSQNTSFVGSIAAATITAWGHTSDITKIDGGKIYTNTILADTIATSTLTSKSITLVVNPGSGDVKIQAGKTDFGSSTAGFILGVDDSDSDRAKFEIGSSTTSLKWSGVTLTVTGASIVAGKAQNSGGTNFLDLGATGSSSFLKCGSAIDILADGSGTFTRTLVSAPNIVASGTVSVSSGTIVGPSSAGNHTFTTHIDTGVDYDAAWYEAASDQYIGMANISAGTSSGTPGSGIYGYTSTELVHGDGLKTGWTPTIGDNRIYLKTTFAAMDDGGNNTRSITISAITWKLIRV